MVSQDAFFLVVQVKCVVCCNKILMECFCSVFVNVSSIDFNVFDQMFQSTVVM